MNIPTIFLMIIIALLGFPIGLIIAKFTKEELKQGKPWFIAILIVCIVAIFISFIFVRGDALFFLIASFVFIFLIARAALIPLRKKKKGREKKKIKKEIKKQIKRKKKR